jgi:DNA topoisomerase-1
MKGLSAKVFRTYNASYTFQNELLKTPDDGTVAEKILAYNRANRQVAVLCNHQRSVPKSHGNQLNKLKEKILGLKYERQQAKKELLELDPKLKKSMPELVEEESELDDEFIERHLKALDEKEEEKLVKKLEKLNEKRKEDGEEPLTLEELRRESKKRSPAAPTADKLEKKLVTLNERIQTQRLLMVDKDEGKTTALSTSKINYIDPRISAAWCAKHAVPIEKIFNKSLRDKFKWAMDAAAKWVCLFCLFARLSCRNSKSIYTAVEQYILDLCFKCLTPS